MKLFKFFYLKYRNLLKYFWLFKAKRTSKNIGLNFYIGGPTSLNINTSIGNYCSTNGMKIIGNGNVVIGDYFHTGNDLLIISSNHNYKNAEFLPYDNAQEQKNIDIGRCVWIGDRVTIIGSIKIGEGAIIAAGSVLTSDVPSLGIAGGNPAKVFKYRNSEHYNKLVENKKFNLNNS